MIHAQQGSPLPGGSLGPTVAKGRPGKYRVGPFYLTPRFNFGPIGLDTNVLYSATERQPDVMVSFGPALDLLLPLGGSGRFYSTGTLDYLYFVKTASQRRLTGTGLAGLALNGARSRFVLEERYGSSYGRPSYQVDQRIAQTQEGTEATLGRRLFGRTELVLRGRRTHNESSEGDYLGTDLRRAFTYDSQGGEGELSFGLSTKTAFVVGGALQQNRYPLDAPRDSDRTLAMAGFRTDSTALVSGRLLVGQRWYESRVPGTATQPLFWAEIDETLNISPRTRIGVAYQRDIVDSVFLTQDGTPSTFSESVALRLEKDLARRVDLRVYGKWLRTRSDGSIEIIVPDQGTVVSPRNDRVREAGADLGYRFRPNFRFSLVATYRDRDSTIAYFGVQGLLVGFNARFDPR